MFRRLYSSLPDLAATARTASTPRAVRQRRLRKRPELANADSDATRTGLTPTELARYTRQRAMGQAVDVNNNPQSQSQWLKDLNVRRTRIRGTQKLGDNSTRVVGQKIYLPNVIFRMVRNFTPPGKPYNPYEATFRVSQSITKTDIRSYLASVYGVNTTYIRTDNYLSPWKRTVAAGSGGWERSRKVYKRAVVGLVDPFYYPQAMEDMTRAEREDRQRWLNEQFFIQSLKDMRTWELLRVTKKSSKNWHWRNRDGFGAQRGKIIERVAEQRAKREQFISDTKNRISQLRQNGEAVVV